MVHIQKKKKITLSSRQKENITYKGKKIGLSSDISAVTFFAEMKWKYKWNVLQQRLYCKYKHSYSWIITELKLSCLQLKSQ